MAACLIHLKPVSFGNFNPGLFGQRMIPFQDDEVSPGNSRDYGHARDYMLKENVEPKVDKEVDWSNINKTDKISVSGRQAKVASQAKLTISLSTSMKFS